METEIVEFSSWNSTCIGKFVSPTVVNCIVEDSQNTSCFFHRYTDLHKQRLLSQYKDGVLSRVVKKSETCFYYFTSGFFTLKYFTSHNFHFILLHFTLHYFTLHFFISLHCALLYITLLHFTSLYFTLQCPVWSKQCWKDIVLH